MLLSNFKLKKAMEYYESGDYKNSIELFKKYSNESDDVLDLHEAVKKIFWVETRKIYSRYIGKICSPDILIMVIISRGNGSMSNYPLFINELIDILSSMSGKSVAALKIPVLLNQGKYNEVIEILPDYNVQRGRRKTNDSFREFLSDFCNREIIFEEDLSETF